MGSRDACSEEHDLFLIGIGRLKISRVEYVLDDYLGYMNELGRSVDELILREIGRIRKNPKYISRSSALDILYPYVLPFIESKNGNGGK